VYLREKKSVNFARKHIKCRVVRARVEKSDSRAKYERIIKGENLMNDQASIFDYIRLPVSVENPIRLIEMFGGVGSQAMALRNLGADFEHYRLIEFDKYPVASYNAIHGTNFIPTDIRDVHAEDLGIVEKDKYTYILTYSFPCQDLSVAGKQRGMAKGSGTRSGLLWEVERILNECTELPQILLMENVNAVHNDQNIEHFKQWINALEKLGYTNYWQDMNAADYGVAQHRERTFMVSLLEERNFKFPVPIDIRYSMADYLEDTVDEKYYVKTEKAMKLIKDLQERGQLDDVSNTVRGGDRGSTDRHQWDLTLSK
jgi:DNA (cytosine-5)-methyltransferase 1